MTPEGAGRPRRRGRPAGRRSEDTRARILDAARIEFARSGYERAALGDIAKAAGITPRALYHYVDSKPELFAAVTDAVLARLGDEVLRRALPATTTQARLRALVDVFRRLYREDPTLVTFFGVVRLESRWNPEVARALARDSGKEATVAVALNRSIVRLALEAGEVPADVDPEGAVGLIESIGAGICLLAGDDADAYEGALAVLDRLIDGTLFPTPPV